MSIPNIFRAVGWIVSELVPMKVRGVEGCNSAVCDEADWLADEEAEYETLEPSAGVELPHPPVAAPSAGSLSDWRLQQHARRWCDLPTLQPGPLPVPDDHPDNT